MSKVDIITVSLPIIWENKEANFDLCSKIFDRLFSRESCSKNGISTSSRLVLLPEMFSCGFTMNRSMAESFPSDIYSTPDKISSPTLLWLMNSSAKYNCAIMTSIPAVEFTTDGAKYYNRAVFMMPDGKFATYDKRHLFRMGNEGEVYTAGNRHTIVNWNGIRFNLNICYDLRFPVWSRNRIGEDLEYDVLLNCANFPESRSDLLEPLVRARSIENMAYMAFVNRSGNDPELSYCNSSYISDYKGRLCGKEFFINIGQSDQGDCSDIITNVQILTAAVDSTEISNFRHKFPAWMDAD